MFQNKTITISKKHVELFCGLTNDTNIIHRDEQDPIVPGMLITSMLFGKPSDYWRLAKMQIKFISPIRVDEPIDYQYELVAERTQLKKYQVKIVRNFELCAEAEITAVRKE